MNRKAVIFAVLLLLLLAPVAAAWSWNPATWISRAFKIGDGKDIDLALRGIGNGYAQDITCISNCTGFNGSNGINGSIGATGANLSLVSVTDNGNYTYTWHYSDGNQSTTSNLRGAAGAAGTAAGATNYTYSYLIFVNNSVYYAKNSTTGSVDYSDTLAETVINNTINHTSGAIKISCGNYSITSATIVLQSSTKLIGESNNCVTFNATYSGNILTADTLSFVEVSGITFGGINATAINQTTSSGYMASANIHDNSFRADLAGGLVGVWILSDVHHNLFGYAASQGISPIHQAINWTGSTTTLNHNSIHNNRIYRSQRLDGAVKLKEGYSNYIYENDWETNNATPLNLTGIYASYIERNWFEVNNVSYQIGYLSGAIGNKIAIINNNYFSLAGTDGLAVIKIWGNQPTIDKMSGNSFIGLNGVSKVVLSTPSGNDSQGYIMDFSFNNIPGYNPQIDELRIRNDHTGTLGISIVTQAGYACIGANGSFYVKAGSCP